MQLPSGAEYKVHSQEVDYLQERVERYGLDNHFTNISDLQDLDRMLMMELCCYRWGRWISSERNYWGDPVEVNELQKAFKEHSNELRQLKRLLGIDKVARDKQRGDDSVAAYIENLRVRAKEFGIMREKQLDKALELFHQLEALLTLHDNCDEIERRDMHLTRDDVLDWIRTIAIPEFQHIDAYFREHQQKFWVRNQ